MINPCFSGLYLLIIVVAKRHGASSALVGVMLSIAAVGGMLSALLAPTFQRRAGPRAALIAFDCLMALTLPLLLITHNPLLLGLITAAIELPTAGAFASIIGQRMALTPDDLQGRTGAATSMIAMSATWLGPLAVGFLLQSAGSTTAILVLFGWAVAVALTAILAPGLRDIPIVPEPDGASSSLAPGQA